MLLQQRVMLVVDSHGGGSDGVGCGGCWRCSGACCSGAGCHRAAAARDDDRRQQLVWWPS
nr:hypothetical protein [Tanacetum cinerariifolium]